MNRILYGLLLGTAAPFVWLGMRRRARKEGGRWDILSRTRFGRYLQPARRDRPVWVHAVSLGETRAAKPLIDALLAAGYPVVLTHSTATGSQQSQAWYESELASDQLEIAWFPYDFARSMRGFLAHYRPRVGILVEREVWPNLVAEAHRAGIPLALVSARLSARSLHTMQRLHRLMAPAFAGIDLVLAQTEEDAQRLRQLGVDEPAVMGNLKFDVELPPALLQLGRAWRERWARPVVVIASTREDEESLFLQAWARIEPGVERPLFILVPRHPRRFADVATLLDHAGVTYRRRSDPRAGAPDDREWLLGDSMGEMPAYFAAADVAIIGGSFADFGGHNLLEASAAQTPVIVGPYTRNFAQATDDALAAGAALRAEDAEDALRRALTLLGDATARQRMAGAAQVFMEAHRGATARAMAALEPYLGQPNR